VTVVVISSAASDNLFTISTNPEKYNCKYCITTTANFVVGRPVYFSAVNFFGGVTSVAESQPIFFGSFIVGMVYTIVTTGFDPRFTSIGALDNNVGTSFTATGSGASEMGTGSATMQPYKIHSKPSVTKFSIRKIGDAIAALLNSPSNPGFMTATTSVETCVPVKNVWGFRRQLLAPEEEQQYIQGNIPINKQGDRFGNAKNGVITESHTVSFAGASVWIDVDPSTVSPNNAVIIVGAPMKKKDNPTEFAITEIKSEHYSYYRPSFEPLLNSFKYKHVFMCNDCQVYVGDRIMFTGTMPACVLPESGSLGGRTGVTTDKIYYVVGIVRKYSPTDEFVPEGFQIAYSMDGAEVTHPNESGGTSGGEDSIINSANTALVTVGSCAYAGVTPVTSTTPNGANPPPLYTYDQASGSLTGPKTLGCKCESPNLKMRIVRVNSAGGAYIWEKNGGVWVFRSRLSIPGPFTPLISNMLWEKSYFGKLLPKFSANSVDAFSGAAVSISSKHKLAFVGCPGYCRAGLHAVI
jgi:hypothetical protein